MKTNHMMVPDNKGRIYCHRKLKVVVFEDDYYKKNCSKCKYLNGIGDGVEIAIECLYNDGSENVAVTIDKPESLVVNYKEMGFKKNGK